MTLIDEAGHKYGRLTVAKRAENTESGEEARWLCVCECGNERAVRGTSLRNGHTQSCGCLRQALAGEISSIPDSEAALRRLLRHYRKGARPRGLRWELSKSTFCALTQQPCHYCGRLPEQRAISRTGTYVYNGIDRIDSGKGYIEGNVVPCCKQCNYAKGTMSQSGFIEMAVQIAEHRIGI